MIDTQTNEADELTMTDALAAFARWGTAEERRVARRMLEDLDRLGRDEGGRGGNGEPQDDPYHDPHHDPLCECSPG
jgi:hypothetical protein